MKICGFLQIYNELEKGNLKRCITNLKKYCDYICVFDDGSTDGSTEYLIKEGCKVIKGLKNDFLNETKHKQWLLETALSCYKDIDWFFWLDCDEVLDANGTKNLREFCEKADKEGYYFPEITLWRSESWKRMDYLGQGKFLRLWKNNGKLKFNIAHGLHADLFPQGLSSIGNCDFNVLHYGYATYEAIVERWRERTRHGVAVEIRKKGLDESQMVLEPVLPNLFPEDCKPKRTEKPKPIKYCVGPNGMKKYSDGGETYIHKFGIKWRKAHLNPTIFKENKELMKGKILFLGCNTGTSTYFLSKYCEELIGIDINKEALEKSEKLFKEHKIENTKFIHCSVFEMPFEDESFDGIYAMDFVEHIYPEDFKLMLDEVYRVLKKGGHLFIQTPRASLQIEKEKKMGAFDPCHKIFFENEDKIKKYLNLNNRFEIIEFGIESRTNPGRPKEKHNEWRVILRK